MKNAKTKSVADLRAMTFNARVRYFRKADQATIEAVTEPCPGAAHTNAHIDHCGVCLGASWGRMLKTC